MVPATDAPFDAALNLWTSLGYYDEDTDVQILQEYAKLVRPGGILVIYIVNRDFVVRHFDPQGYEAFGDIVHIEQRHLDLASSRMRNEWRFFRRNGEDLDHILTVPIEHGIYSLHELRPLLVRGGGGSPRGRPGGAQGSPPRRTPPPNRHPRGDTPS